MECYLCRQGFWVRLLCACVRCVIEGLDPTCERHSARSQLLLYWPTCIWCICYAQLCACCERPGYQHSMAVPGQRWQWA